MIKNIATTSRAVPMLLVENPSPSEKLIIIIIIINIWKYLLRIVSSVLVNYYR